MRRRIVLLLASIGLALVLASGVALLQASMKPAQAAFPGRNGDIAFIQQQNENSFESAHNIFRMSKDGTLAREIYAAPGSSTEPTWSPDGTKIAFRREDPNEPLTRGIWLMDANGSGATQLSGGDPLSLDSYPAWFPSGNKIVFGSIRANPSSTNLYVMSLDDAGNVAGVNQLTSNSAYQPAVSPDGSKIAFVSDRDGDDEIYVMRADRSEGPNNIPVKLTNNTAYEDRAPDWSPDGTKIAYFRFDNTARTSDIFVKNANGPGKKNLSTKSEARDQEPVFLPNGRFIAFSSDRDGDFDIWRMRADGTDPIKLTNNAVFDANPDWQPLP